MHQATFDTYIKICPQIARYIPKSSSSFPSPFATNIAYPFHISLDRHSQPSSNTTFCLMCSISLSTYQLCLKPQLCFFSVRPHRNYLYMYRIRNINPLNAKLNPICHMPISLGDLTFMGQCIISIFQYITNKMQRYTVNLYLETALHVPGGTSTHHQERIQLYLQQLVFVTPSLQSAATSWNRLECAVGGLRHPQHTQTSSNPSTIAADSSNGVTNTRSCRYISMRS
jgi:hypothetical protein